MLASCTDDGGAAADPYVPPSAGFDAGGPTCSAGKAASGESCSNLALDRENCGVCGLKCGPAEVCSVGKCGLGCGGGTTKCGDVCVDTKVDANNCGACGKVCGDHQACAPGGDGVGACACTDGLSMCGTTCVDLQNSGDNCGGCGTKCAAGQECAGGTCRQSVSEWRFEDNVTDTRGKNNGTAQGSVTYVTSSWSQKAGKAGFLTGGVTVKVDTLVPSFPHLRDAHRRGRR